jgi:molybdate/tungstate transport system substrate-binding protein
MENTSHITTRRQLLQTAGTAAIAGVAGCLDGSLGTWGDGQSPTIRLLAAGSLQNALTNGVKPAVDVPVEIETHGSATVARLINEGQRDPDIVSVADLSLFEAPLSPAWHCEFTSNSLVIAYNPDTNGGTQLAEAGVEHWYEPMVNGNVNVGRTDPDQDPLGYRTLFMFELASRYYDDASDLGGRILQQNQVYPETSLLSQFETGSIDAAVAYRNMAIEREYAYIELPDQLNLSNPQYIEDWYSTTSYTLPSGQEIHGGLISYGATIRQMSDAAVSVFDVLTTGTYLEEQGFLLGEQFPAYTGAVPQRVNQASRSAENASRLDSPGTADSAVTSDNPALI